MGRPTRSLLVLALGVAATLVIASCGGSDARLLPGSTARDITANLDTVRQLADEGDCVGAESAAQQVSEQVEALGGIDAKLKQALREGAARLNEVIAGCEESISEETVPTTVVPESEVAEGEPAKKKKKKQKQKTEEKPKEQEPTPETAEPPLPPQANGEGKGLGNGNAPPAGEEGNEESSSGGVGPGTAVEGGG